MVATYIIFGIFPVIIEWLLQHEPRAGDESAMDMNVSW